MAQPLSDLHGLLVVDKPGLPQEFQGTAGEPTAALLTSHDVVQRVRRLTGQRRIGHTGTLDPMASGVLVLCLGRATRLVEYYQGHAKQYRADITLGSATDTYDAVGTVTAHAPVPPLTTTALEQALALFRGAIQQRPPVYSALKQGGESLHRKARRGEEVVVKARPVTIHRLELIDWNGSDRLTVDVHCSAGTYIRSLADDLGKALGTVGHLSRLRRTAAGAFSIDDAHTLDAIADNPADNLLPAGAGLDMPCVRLDEERMRRLSFGQKIVIGPEETGEMIARKANPSPSRERSESDAADSLLAAYDPADQFLGIVIVLEERSDGSQLWKAQKWLATA